MFCYQQLRMKNHHYIEKINEKILQILFDFENNTILKPIGKDFYGIEDLYTLIQIQFQGGEDLLKD